MSCDGLDIIRYGYIYIIIVNGLVYVGSSVNGNRLKQHLKELYTKALLGEAFTRKIFVEIKKLVEDIYCFSKNKSYDEFVKDITKHPNFDYKIIEHNIKITSLTTLKQYEQYYIEKYNSINNGLNTNRAFIDATLIHIYKKEYDQKLMSKNPIRRCLRLLVSKEKELLSYVFDIPVVFYNKHSPQNDKVSQMNTYMDNLENNPVWYASFILDTLMLYRANILNKNDFVKYISHVNNNNIKQLLILILNLIDKHKYFNSDMDDKKHIIKYILDGNIK